MTHPNGRFSAEEVAALAAGVLVVAVAVVVTTQVRPVPFPLDLALSLCLGTAAYMGLLKVLDPRTPGELTIAQAAADYRALLAEMKVIAARIWVASQQQALQGPTAHRLRTIASTVGVLVSRYQADRAAFAGASATLTVLQQFDRVLAGYLRIKSGAQFVEARTRQAEILETEERTIPMVQAALQTLGEQVDAGGVVDKKVWEGTLASLLHSLNLIQTSGQPAARLEDKGGSR